MPGSTDDRRAAVTSADGGSGLPASASAPSVPATPDHAFLDRVGDRLAGLPHGARRRPRRLPGRGHARSGQRLGPGDLLPGPFDPAALRALGWKGEVSEVGGWGGGVFNGGAWLTVDGRRVDVAYAKANHAPKGRLTEVTGAIATAAVQVGHGAFAARGEWVTNEKRLLERADLRGVDGIIGALTTASDADALVRAVEAAESMLEPRNP